MIRTLIVDDQKHARETIKYILQQDPELEVVGAASDGREAVKLAATLRPDIILMDLEMPNLDGLAATKLICQQHLDIAIIILTIQDRHDLLVKSLDAGAKGYLLKTLAPAEIVETIKLIYGGNPFSQHILNQQEEISSTQKTSEYKPSNNLKQTKDYIDVSPHQIETEKNNDSVSYERDNFNFSTLLAILDRRYYPALLGFVGVLLGAILYLVFAQKNYRTTALISLEDRQESVSELGRNLSSVVGSNEYSPLASQVQLIQSQPVLNNALEKIAQEKNDYLSEKNQELSAKTIQENLDIKILPNTNILEISYVNPNPEFATILLNEIINAVIARNTDIIRSEASSVREFLEQEVSKQRNELNKLETAENRYREQQRIVAIDNQTTNLVNRLNNLAIQEQDLLTQIKEQETQVNNLKQIAKVNDAESAYVEGIISQDSQLEQLRSQLTDVEAELATARSKFTDNNPTVIDLLEARETIFNLYQQQVSSILGERATISPSEIKANIPSQTRNGLGQEVFSQLITTQTQLEANRDKLQAIRVEIEKLENQIALLPEKVQSLTELVRQKTQADQSWQFLQRQLEEARIAEAQLVSNIQLVEQASIPSSPSSPQPRVVLAIASAIGIIFGVGIILLLEKIDRTFYGGTESESQLKIPFLSTLPHLSDNPIELKEIKSFLNNKELYEPYRSLLKQLESRLGNGSKTIVVTSAIAHEGKSVVASHLAAVSAMLSRKTLIIDAHLYQPEQYRLFDVQLQPGLKEIFSDSLALNQVIQSTKIDNLSVLTSGISTPNSCTIVESPNILRILKEAENQYDLIIIDTPSVSGSCDAYTLSQYSDGLVMVARPLISNKDSLAQTVENLKRNKAPIIGFVINHAQNQLSDLYENLQNIKKSPPLLLGSNKNNSSRRETKEISQP